MSSSSSSSTEYAYDDEATDVDEPLHALLSLSASTSTSASTTPGSRSSQTDTGDDDFGGGVLQAISPSSSAALAAKARRRRLRLVGEQRVASPAARVPAKRKMTKMAQERVARRRHGARECAFCGSVHRPDLTMLQLTTKYQFPHGDGEVREQKQAFYDDLVGREEHGVDDVLAHRSCLLWAPRVYEDPTTSEWRNVAAEVKRGVNPLLKCFVCGMLGAVTGCGDKKCKRTAHYSCLLTVDEPDKKWWFDGEDYEAWCPRHRPQRHLAQVEPFDQQPQAQAQAPQELVIPDDDEAEPEEETKQQRKEEPERVPGERARRELWKKLWDEEIMRHDDDAPPVPSDYSGPLNDYPQLKALNRYCELVPVPLDMWDKMLRLRLGVRSAVALKMPVVTTDDESETDTEQAEQAEATDVAEAAETDEPVKATEAAEAAETDEIAAEVEPQETPEEKAAREAVLEPFMQDPTVDATIDRYVRWDLRQLSPSREVDGFMHDTERDLAAMQMHDFDEIKE